MNRYKRCIIHIHVGQWKGAIHSIFNATNYMLSHFIFITCDYTSWGLVMHTDNDAAYASAAHHSCLVSVHYIYGTEFVLCLIQFCNAFGY